MGEPGHPWRRPPQICMSLCRVVQPGGSGWNPRWVRQVRSQWQRRLRDDSARSTSVDGGDEAGGTASAA
jgi:hypothetical protein